MKERKKIFPIFIKVFCDSKSIKEKKNDRREKKEKRKRKRKQEH